MEENAKSEKNANTFMGAFPSLSYLFSIDWIIESKPENFIETDSHSPKKIVKFSRLEGFLRTGFFQLDKCINLDNNISSTGFLCNKSANRAFLDFRYLTMETKTHKKEKKNGSLLSMVHPLFDEMHVKEVLTKTHESMVQIMEAEEDCEAYKNILEEDIKYLKKLKSF